MRNCDYFCYRVSKTEFIRLLNSYDFIRKVRTKYYVNNGSYTYAINAERFITEYFFVGRKIDNNSLLKAYIYAKGFACCVIFRYCMQRIFEP